MKIKILFVCLGNICRSPMAEGIFKHLVKEKGLSESIICDSAGTSSYHVGALPDPRMIETARRKLITLDHRGRQFSTKDFSDFDYILAMDSQNLENINLLKTAGNIKAKVFLMREFDTNKGNPDVPDPYYGGPEGFEDVYNMLYRCCNNFLNKILEDQKKNGG